MTAAVLILALVTLQRLGELVLAARNTKALLARGAQEVGASHYPLIVLLHAAWLLSLWYFAPGRPVNLLLLALLLLLQLARAWVICTLGARWTTRILMLRGEPRVTTGPFRYVSHPNYIVVAGEIFVLPMMFYLPGVAIIFTLLNGLILALRIRLENESLAQ